MTRKSACAGSMLLWAVLAGSAAGGQAPPFRNVMRDKLEHSQGILAAVVTSNWAALDQHGRELVKLTNDPAWVVLTTPEYSRYSTGFLRATEDVLAAAALRDEEAASVAFVSLTLSCVQCHRYVARSRIAGVRE